MKIATRPSIRTVVLRSVSGVLLALAAALPAVAQTSSTTAAAVAADLRMAQDSQPHRRLVDDFVAAAMAGDVDRTLAMLSPALVARTGDAGARRALEGQILPFFTRGRALGRSTTVARTTDASGNEGYAFYLWMEQQAAGTARQPFSLYVVEEQGRLVVANVVPDRLVAGRHR